MTVHQNLPIPYEPNQNPPLLFKGGDRGEVADVRPTDTAKANEHYSQTPSSEEEGASEPYYQPGHTPIFSPQSQARFLDNLSINGNVRHACKVAGVSAQTAYRARRKSGAFANLWDAALLSARTHAEGVLAERALKGTEESVFYHGEEVATRIRYDARLLLAHLARLDKLAERADVADQLARLDDAMDALKRGEELPETPVLRQAGPEHSQGAQHERSEGGDNSPQDCVPSVPSCRESSLSSAAIGRTKTPTSSAAIGRTKTPSSSEAVGQTKPPPPPEPCPKCGGKCLGPEKELGLMDCQWICNRIERMEEARPPGEFKLHQLGYSIDKTEMIEYLQLEGFEAGVAEWWLIEDEPALDVALDRLRAQVLAQSGAEGVLSCAEEDRSNDTKGNDGRGCGGIDACERAGRAGERGDLCEDPGHTGRCGGAGAGG